jgi:hypothetical protein
MKPVFVRGVGLYTPGFDSPRAWCERKEDALVDDPPAKVLEGALRRRATPLTRLSIEALVQATEVSGSDLTLISSVWATAHGEHTPAIKMLAMMKRGEGRVSPTQFHNSVHNTAGGYASIASNNTARSTTLTGGSELVGSALLEAFGLLSAYGEDVAVVLADEPLQAPFEAMIPTAPLSLAFVLSLRPDHALGRLTRLARSLARGARPEDRFGRLHVSGALRLVERLVRRESGTIPIELESSRPETIWTVDLECSER